MHLSGVNKWSCKKLTRATRGLGLFCEWWSGDWQNMILETNDVLPPNIFLMKIVAIEFFPSFAAPLDKELWVSLFLQ